MSTPRYSGKPVSRQLKHYRKLVAEAEAAYTNWLDKVRYLPNVPLTEEEWEEACRYFNGCAFCDIDSIDARGFFIRFQDGGKYCAYNVVPMCEKCAVQYKLQPNPFRQMHKDINRNLDRKRGMGIEKLHKVVEYLDGKIEEAKRRGNEQNVS